MNAKEIGTFLSELRKQRGLKQIEVAEAIQVSDKAISRWETGKGIPDVGSLQELSNFYEVSINEILAGRYIKEEEMKKTADENVKELVKKEFSLRKKLLIAITGSVCLVILFVISMIPLPGIASSFETSDIDKVFDYVDSLEDEGIEYGISFDTNNKTITIMVDDRDYINNKFNK